MRGGVASAFKTFILLFLVIILSGCKIAVYHNLSETESNEMLALLLSNNVSAAKQVDQKGDTATLMVEKSQLARAIRILEDNGYPKKKFATVNEIFPPGQLITSPEQQQVKVIYSKEQQLDKMLSLIPGVIHTSVQLTESVSSGDSLDTKSKPPTASVLIVYSTSENIDAYMAKIRSLVRGSVPGLTDENLSVVMMPAKTLPKPSVGKDKALSSTLLSLMGNNGSNASVSHRDVLNTVVLMWNQYMYVIIGSLVLLFILLGILVRLFYVSVKSKLA